MTRSLKNFTLSLVGFCCLCLTATKVAGQEVSIRNNLLYDATGTPNLGVEVQVGDHVSVGVNGSFKSWPRFLAWDNDVEENPQRWRHFLVAPEARYYFNEVFKGAFVGVDFLYSHFNVGGIKLPFGLYPELEEHRDQGSYWGGGAFMGYAWWPFQHWRLELAGGAAVGLAAYDRYACEHCGSKLAEERKVAVIPQVGLNIAYNPVARNKRKPRGQIIERTDTLTVMTPPVAFVVNLQPVKGPQSEGDRLAQEKPWVIPISKYRPLDYLTRPGRDSVMYVLFPAGSSQILPEYPQDGRNGAVLDELQKASRSSVTTKPRPRSWSPSWVWPPLKALRLKTTPYRPAVPAWWRTISTIRLLSAANTLKPLPREKPGIGSKTSWNPFRREVRA